MIIPDPFIGPSLSFDRGRRLDPRPFSAILPLTPIEVTTTNASVFEVPSDQYIVITHALARNTGGSSSNMVIRYLPDGETSASKHIVAVESVSATAVVKVDEIIGLGLTSGAQLFAESTVEDMVLTLTLRRYFQGESRD